jgi:hypothetical protein
MISRIIENGTTYPILLIHKEYGDIYLFSNKDHCTLVHNASNLNTLGDSFSDMILSNFKIYNDNVILSN